jgi:hypothetical protein
MDKSLLWWNTNTIQFSILSMLARRYLAILATSALIERTFSISSNTVIENRNRLILKRLSR